MLNLGYADDCADMNINGYGAYLDEGNAFYNVRFLPDNEAIEDAEADKAGKLAADASWLDPMPCFFVRRVDWSAEYVGTERQCTRVYQASVGIGHVGIGHVTQHVCG